jgi:hypothetical protein
MVTGMVVIAVLFVAEASRQGTGRVLVATALGVAWLAVTAVAFRSRNQFEAGYAVRNYVVVMAVALLVYFRVRRGPGDRSGNPKG